MTATHGKRPGLLDAAAIALLALVLRLVFLAQIRGTPLTDVLLLDSEHEETHHPTQLFKTSTPLN